MVGVSLTNHTEARRSEESSDSRVSEQFGLVVGEKLVCFAEHAAAESESQNTSETG